MISLDDLDIEPPDYADIKTRYDNLLLEARGRCSADNPSYHKHRIKPGYAGGEYIEDNILYLTREEHIEIHRLRYNLFGNHRDLLACKLLGADLSEGEWEACAKAGGVTTGSLFKDKKLGVCGRSKEQMSLDGKKGRAALPVTALAKGGHVTGSLSYKQGFGLFGQSEEQWLLNRQKGGRAAALLIKYEDRVKGSLGTIWVTNGEKNIRLKKDNLIPQGFHYGKSKRKRNPNCINLDDLVI